MCNSTRWTVNCKLLDCFRMAFVTSTSCRKLSMGFWFKPCQTYFSNVKKLDQKHNLTLDQTIRQQNQSDNNIMWIIHGCFLQRKLVKVMSFINKGRSKFLRGESFWFSCLLWYWDMLLVVTVNKIMYEAAGHSYRNVQYKITIHFVYKREGHNTRQS